MDPALPPCPPAPHVNAISHPPGPPNTLLWARDRLLQIIASRRKVQFTLNNMCSWIHLYVDFFFFQEIWSAPPTSRFDIHGFNHTQMENSIFTFPVADSQPQIENTHLKQQQHKQQNPAERKGYCLPLCLSLKVGTVHSFEQLHFPPNGAVIFKLDCSMARRLYFLFHAWCSTGFQKRASFSVFSKSALCSKIWKRPFQSWMERWKSSSI